VVGTAAAIVTLTPLRWSVSLAVVAMAYHAASLVALGSTPTVWAIETYLASRLCEHLTLDGIARVVYMSPFYLARVFQQRTGMPVHRYLTRLRLRASLERLAEGVNNLTALALELGFSSHSHFADAFRREFAHAHPRCAGTPAERFAK
jgi:AraC-like DNA-binding protein